MNEPRTPRGDHPLDRWEIPEATRRRILSDAIKTVGVALTLLWAKKGEGTHCSPHTRPCRPGRCRPDVCGPTR